MERTGWSGVEGWTLGRAVMFAALVVLVAAEAAVANMGTPLMWLQPFHLLLGNAVIGVVEGAIIARLFRASFGVSIFLMVLANYLTMVVGMALLPEVHEWVLATLYAGEERLFAAPRAMAWMWGVAAAGSVLAEWPFVAFAVLMRKKKTGGARSIGLGFVGAVVVHAVSYSCIIPVYQGAGTQSLHTDFAVERDTAFVTGRVGAWVYFVDDAAGEVRRVRLEGGEVERVSGLEEGFRIVPRTVEGRWEVWGVRGRGEERVLVASGTAGRVDSSMAWEQVLELSRIGWAYSADLQAQKKWTARCGGWALDGLMVRREGDGLWFQAAYETVFARWQASCATALPEDLVVWQVGEWIAVLDCEARRWGLLTRGRHPVVVLDE